MVLQPLRPERPQLQVRPQAVPQELEIHHRALAVHQELEIHHQALAVHQELNNNGDNSSFTQKEDIFSLQVFSFNGISTRKYFNLG